MTEARDFILATVTSLRPEDFAFTVSAQGPPWDVYRFTRQGRKGTVAVRIVSQSLEIGLFRAGELTEAQVIGELLKSAPS